jgi:hypothetical protein
MREAHPGNTGDGAVSNVVEFSASIFGERSIRLKTAWDSGPE